ncbi:hypothetical protein GV827_16830 [Sulfitobacter sp. JBTF-M27]|uniref:Uncharacterized protein n=1 Tax=Sulfitobacter sediminilitoris TaxID=2698830 RepID=A0A6P0CDU2_9RHOB|nr:hypothetical protein [Sulfitobacter sediminilitoris]NEK24057.1 hypothetical protein [Sulfitobacter sediminilitoris]
MDDPFNLHEDDVVVIKAFDEWPEHLFQVWEVYDDCITGYSLSGPLEGVYGEPAFDLILRVHSRADG